MGYALKFEMNEYLLSPVLFHNIYKGALGEVAGKFILKRELGIIMDVLEIAHHVEVVVLNKNIIVMTMMKTYKIKFIPN